jgi:hypothetical protein
MITEEEERMISAATIILSFAAVFRVCRRHTPTSDTTNCCHMSRLCRQAHSLTRAIPLITQNCHKQIYPSVAIFVLIAGTAVLLSCHLFKAVVLRVEPIPTLIYVDKILRKLPSYPIRKCLIPILITLEKVGRGVGQVGSCGGSLLKETKLKLSQINLGW